MLSLPSDDGTFEDRGRQLVILVDLMFFFIQLGQCCRVFDAAL